MGTVASLACVLQLSSIQIVQDLYPNVVSGVVRVYDGATAFVRA